jgi:hypothetical protein
MAACSATTIAPDVLFTGISIVLLGSRQDSCQGPSPTSYIQTHTLVTIKGHIEALQRTTRRTLARKIKEKIQNHAHL